MDNGYCLFCAKAAPTGRGGLGPLANYSNKSPLPDTSFGPHGRNLGLSDIGCSHLARKPASPCGSRLSSPSASASSKQGPLICDASGRPMRAMIVWRLSAALSRGLILTFGLAASAAGQVQYSLPPQDDAMADGQIATRGRSSRRLTVFRGRELHYEVVEGMAVHAGDMVLGTAEEAVAASLGPELTKPLMADWPLRHDISAVSTGHLWPDGIVPYVVDSGVPESHNIQSAIEEWNSKTIIKWVPRTTQRDFVKFQSTQSGFCWAHVGRIGGQQAISIPPTGCSVNALVHEMGHAVGLWHEHERMDRDTHIMLIKENLAKHRVDSYVAEHPVNGPYDFRSTMHYDPYSRSRNGRAVMETIPPGIPIPSATLSDGDIDGIARLYGHPPTNTTIATNPPGLEIIVDGERTTTPASFHWEAGSQHVLVAPLVQTGDNGRRFLFGRWNDKGDRQRTLTSGPSTTWIEANYIVQHKVRPSPQPSGSGIVRISPESPDGYYTLRSLIRVSALENPQRPKNFQYWSPRSPGNGQSENPAVIQVSQDTENIQAYFHGLPMLRFVPNIDAPVGIDFNGYNLIIPYNLPICIENWTGCEVNAGGTITADESEKVTPIDRKAVRYKWIGFSSENDNFRIPHSVSRSGITATINVEEEFELVKLTAGEGVIEVSPPSTDGFYSRATEVVAEAIPAIGWELATWSGDASGDSAIQLVEMSEGRYLEAVFVKNQRLHPGVANEFFLPATNYRFKTYFTDQGFFVYIPHGSTSVEVSFNGSPQTAEIDLYVRHGNRVRWQYGNDGRTPVFHADFESVMPGANEHVVITGHSDPPLKAGVYYVGLVVHTPRTRITGTLKAEIRGGGSIMQASPRALTFVSTEDRDPAEQRIRLDYDMGGQSPHRVRIESNEQWLSASPQQLTLAGSGSAEIAVQAHSAGLVAESHSGELRVVQLYDQPTGNGDALQTVNIPVALVVVPATHISELAVQG